MPVIDGARGHITFKLVYVGPEGAGKTTNLEALRKLVDPAHCGSPLRLDSDKERSLFFDLLPLFFALDGIQVRFKIFTTPGKPAHRMTRRAILRGADGIVFVADSNPNQASLNQYAFSELQEDLSMMASDATTAPPLLTQFNKRDLGDAVQVTAFADEAIQEASATGGDGVRETLLEMAERLWQGVENSADLPEGLHLSAQDFRKALATHIAKA